MPKILVGNLPVTAYVNAEVEYEDGPEHTLHERVAAGVRAGRWKRAEGQHAEEYGDLDLEADTRVLDYPQWSFDILAGGPDGHAIIPGATWRQSVPPGIHVTVRTVGPAGVCFRWSGGSMDTASEAEFRLWFEHVRTPSLPAQR